MDRCELGRCHQCGHLLLVHGQLIAEGYQHEEYYCRACGGIERRAIRLRLEDPAWRKVYERRQKLIARGPAAGRFLKRHRSDTKAARRWIEEIFRLGRGLVEDGNPAKPEAPPGRSLEAGPRPARERQP